MAKCGWCKTKNLQKENGQEGKALENHKVPNTNKWCEGQSTAPGYQIRTKR